MPVAGGSSSIMLRRNACGLTSLRITRIARGSVAFQPECDDDSVSPKCHWIVDFVDTAPIYTADFPAESSVEVLRCVHANAYTQTRTRANTQCVISSVSRFSKCCSHGIRGYQGNEDHKMALIFLREGVWLHVRRIK